MNIENIHIGDRMVVTGIASEEQAEVGFGWFTTGPAQPSGVPFVVRGISAPFIAAEFVSGDIRPIDTRTKQFTKVTDEYYNALKEAYVVRDEDQDFEVQDV